MSSGRDGHRLQVAVIFGGRSGEHEVSLASARSVIENLDPARYDVTLVGITKDGRWLLPDDGARALTEGLTQLEGSRALLPADYGSRVLLRTDGSRLESALAVDVAFPVLHGPYGEDGTVQGLLELAGVPYVGAGVLGSAVAMDKVMMKTLFRAAGLPVADFVPVRKVDWQTEPAAVAQRLAQQIGFPCFVKPANLGSSVGISKVHGPQELTAALDLAAEYDTRLIVERSVENAREIECSVLGNHAPEVSVPGEIIPCDEFYSYRAKYVDEGSQLIIPAELPEAVAQQVRELSAAAFEATDCAGMARVDFLVTRDDHRVFVSEINTIPGFTRISMYPKLWEASGLPYPRLLDRLIELALERHAERSALRTSYA